MALGTIPPWLNVGPTDYLHAIQAGTQAGLEVSRMRAAAEEAAARRIAAQQEAQRQAWEFGENLRQRAALAAAENEQQREYQSGMLDWRRQQMQMDAEKAAAGDREAQARLDETMRHNLATEALGQARNERDVTPTEVDLDPSKYYVTSGGAVVQPRKDTTPREISPSAALGIVSDPVKWVFAQNALGPESTNLMNIARSGIIPRSAGLPQAGTISTNAVPSLGTNAPSSSLKQLDRQTALDLLNQSGGDKAKARQMARELGYTF